MEWAAVACLFCLWAGSHAQPIVDTEYGQVSGRLLSVDNGEFIADVNTFHGIPYAKSTAGDGRFRNPEKRAPWAPAVFDARELGQGCPQGGGGLTDFTHPGYDNYGEDCLNMDIYTPTTPGPHPVMVWLHGGAYQGGTNIQYPGHFLATRNIVVAVVNYRLGDFGFAYTGNAAAPGNAGLFDQRMALEFVRDNIANFGGDPNKVTLFGQSAGASSTGIHVVSPLSQGEGLFHQAIMESGTEWNFWSVNLPESHPENYIREVAGGLNCSVGRDDLQMIECLRTIPWDVMRRADFDCTPGWYCLGMAPVVDGAFLPDKPTHLREAGNYLKGPIMAEIMEADGSFYTMGMIPESIQGGFNHSEWMYHLETDLMSIWAPLMYNDTYDEFLHAIEYNYSPWPYIEDEYANRDAYNKMITDAGFGNPWDKQMLHHSQFEDVFGTVFNFRGRNSSDLVPEWMGCPHMAEIPYTWGWTLLKFNDEVRNDSGFANDIIDWTDEDVLYTVYWNKLYANFAHTGNPTPEPVADPIGGMTDWRPFTEEDRAILYLSNTTVEVVAEWRQKDYAFWNQYARYIAEEEIGEIIDPAPANLKGFPAGYMFNFMESYYETVAQQRFEDL